jgi:NAD(P)-dependent dehydrogenase (short-subunit alcohol dehydrogenase family)
VLSVNLTSTFLCFREGVRHFRRHGGGRLVALASRQGAEGGVPEQAAYAASKAGVIRLVEATAKEYGGEGISASAVAPSMILFGGQQGKGVSAERIAGLCAYLASEAGAIHTGTVLRAYGPA